MADDKYLTIEDDSDSEDIFDINYLKNEAIDELQRLSGKEWTDYNIHDPGITTLEILCFALTELAYRTDYNIEDIFYKDNVNDFPEDTFFPAEKILTSGLVTGNDIKRQLLDLEEIKNVHIVPAKNIYEFNGLFDVHLELLDINLSAEQREVIEQRVIELLNDKRVLSTDLNKVVFLDSDLVSINLTLELLGKVDPSDLLRSIATTIENYFSPSPSFIGLEELRDKGASVEDIYLGPLLKNGFLPEANINSFKIRELVLISDLINVIMDVDKVSHISEIHLRDEEKHKYNWLYTVKKGRVPRLNFLDSNLIVTYKGKESFSLNFSDLIQEKLNIGNGLSNSYKKNTLSVPKGVKRDFLNFRSIQLDFPKVYGVGDSGYSVGASEANKAEAKQFKGYLALFDQVFANYFAQLNHLKELFSLKDIKTTVATQLLEDAPGIYWIYKPFIDEHFIRNHESMDENVVKKEWKAYVLKHKKSIEDNFLQAVEDEQSFLKRRNRILDHLLARFGHDLTSFEFVSQLSQKELIDHKIKLLKGIEELGTNRLKGASKTYDFIEMLNNRCGYARYLYAILGLNGGGTKVLSDIPEKIFYKDEDKSNPVSLKFENVNSSETLEELLLLGSNKNNFTLENDILNIFSNNGEVFTTSKIKTKDSDLFIEQLHANILKLNSDSEGLYLIEHLLLKPSDEMNSFGFLIQMNDKVIFESKYDFTRLNRDSKVSDFSDSCKGLDNFEIKEIDFNQYKIVWNGSEIQLVGCYYFDSIKDAQDELKNYMLFFNDLTKIDSCIKRYTKYKDFYNELSDPFSNIITYILPNWPVRFQNSAFKKYIEEVLLAETPAHVYANIIWMNFEQIKSFEKHYEKWFDTINSAPSKHEKALTELLPFFVK